MLVFAGLSWVAVKLLLRKSVNEATAPRWLVLATRRSRPALPMPWCRSVSGLSWACWRWCCWCCCALTDQQLAPATPPDAPNRFVINVMPDQGDAFLKALNDAGVRKFDWYPMIRGRPCGERAHRLARRLYRRPRQAPG